MAPMAGLPDRAARLRAALARDGATCIWCGRPFGAARAADDRARRPAGQGRPVVAGERGRRLPALQLRPRPPRRRSSGSRSACAGAGHPTSGRLARALDRPGRRDRPAGRPAPGPPVPGRPAPPAARGADVASPRDGAGSAVGRVEQHLGLPGAVAGRPAVDCGARSGPTGLAGDRAWTVGRRRRRRPPGQGRAGHGDVAATGDPDADAAALSAARSAAPSGWHRCRRQPGRRAGAPRLPPGHRPRRAGRGAGGLLGRRPARQPAASPRRRRARLGRPHAARRRGRAGGDPDAEALPRASTPTCGTPGGSRVGDAVLL